MQVLLLLLVATPAVVVAMKPEGECEPDESIFKGMSACGSVINNPPMETNIECLQETGLISLFTDIVPRNGSLPAPQAVLCFHSTYKTLTKEEQRSLSTCVLQKLDMFEDDRFNLSGYLGNLTAKINEIEDSRMIESLHAAVYECRQPSKFPDVGSIMDFEKCLMRRCGLYVLITAT